MYIPVSKNILGIFLAVADAHVYGNYFQLILADTA
jgi:hypothetical protein